MPAAKTIRRALLLIIPVLLLAGWMIWRQLQGPELPGYRLETRPLVQRVVASGEVDSQSLAQVGSEITGVIAVRHVREGDAVKAGDLLLELRDDEQRARLREAEAALQQLIDSSRPQAQATLREAQNNLEQADRELQRRETLFERKLLASEALEQARRATLTARVVRDRARFAAAAVGEGGSEEQVLRQRLEAARANLAKARIHAQVDGIVQTREVEPGDLVQPGRTLLTIARSGSSEILLPLDEKNLAPIELGQAARIIADAYPDRVLPARVSFIAPSVDTARGTIDVHLDLLEPADFLRQGMTVSVNIETGRREQALVLPNDALRARDGTRAQVLRVNDGVVERVGVRLGMLGTALSEVSEGLAAGDLVLIGDAEEGQRVRVREQTTPTGIQD
ncbi:membrane fusion protein [Stutzerimonas stutzeri]|uniref:efflux RND transporter periplasmic adaptor subunit n=1 Tax=Stutzerimonas stutzeri subgroup TaxID=578833 RepID=UPI000C6E79F1|nr:efflux RND transporter periplasmic adaptor subunit [Stutzerimonas stutzeri]MCQ2047180.1 efflux RND transporter periplasmic adaptor subunit [Stutzerimonas kunmingensis]PKR28473.1 efflux RND transporter periplasmic adaptor subunit [Stutzerimonas stutzeri]QQC10100.1 efflux RND transporter periplasmic adaptor subunit [Stutzerimonas stutzeri]VEI33832.1 membrane fusion protein [Stutzerimonas stutzeri]